MKALIDAHLFKQLAQDRTRVARNVGDPAATGALVIRNALPADAGRLARLALLDSAPEPHGPMLVAEREGMLVAALPLGSGRAIADPFAPSADAVGLLELRRAQLHPAA